MPQYHDFCFTLIFFFSLKLQERILYFKICSANVAIPEGLGWSGYPAQAHNYDVHSKVFTKLKCSHYMSVTVRKSYNFHICT